MQWLLTVYVTFLCDNSNDEDGNDLTVSLSAHLLSYTPHDEQAYTPPLPEHHAKKILSARLCRARLAPR